MRPPYPYAYGWTKEQSIGLKPPPGVTGEVMNETNATMTATTAGAEARSPKAEIRGKAEAPNAEDRAPLPVDESQRSRETLHVSRFTFHTPRPKQLALALLAAAVDDRRRLVRLPLVWTTSAPG